MDFGEASLIGVMWGMKTMKRSILSKVAFAFVALILGTTAPAAQAQAWITATGTVRAVTLSGGSNEAFRVYVSQNGVDQLGQCTADFVYINTSDDNYQAKVAALLSAYAMQKAVAISYVSATSGFCQMTDFSMQ